jgi:hypothetical protein
MAPRCHRLRHDRLCAPSVDPMAARDTGNQRERPPAENSPRWRKHPCGSDTLGVRGAAECTHDAAS